MKFAVDVHPLVTVLAVLVGGALLGIIGALVAIPRRSPPAWSWTSTCFPRRNGGDAT